MPFFSIVIPTYNRENLIAATLDSILTQGFEDLEVIVVDDGSTDRTVDVVAQYGDRVCILRQQNRGPGAARNLGIAQASGRYVCLFDSDDLHFPWTLATYARLLQQYGEPAFLTGQPHVFHDPAELATVRPGCDRVETFEDYYAASDAWRWFSASSFVVRRDVLQSLSGFVEEPINSEDCDLAMQLGTARGFVHVLAPVTFAYREHPASLKSDLVRAYRGVSHLIDQEQHGRYPGGGERRAQRIEILSRHIRPFALDCARCHPRFGWDLYLRTWSWHVRLRRWKFLAGLPVQALLHRARSASRQWK